MALIVLTAASGAPGVTTAAVGLTLMWYRSATLVDADPGAHRSVLAGYLRGQIATGKGLQRVAEAHRDRRPLAEMVSDETISLTDAEDSDRRLLPGFARPANAALFGPVWPDLSDTLADFDRLGIDVVVDAGRLPANGLPGPLVDRADLVLLLTRTSLRAIAAARSYSEVLVEQSRLTGQDNLGLVLIGDNQPYGSREISALLKLPTVTTLADDPESAAVFSDGLRRTRRFGRSPLVRSLHRAVDDIASQVRRRRLRLGLDADVRSDDGLRVAGDPGARAGVGASTVDFPVPLAAEPAAGGDPRA